MSKPRSEIRPSGLHWAILGIQFLLIALLIVPRNTAETLLFFLCTLFVLTLHWRFRQPDWLLSVLLAILVVCSFKWPHVTYLLSPLLCLSCMHNRPWHAFFALVPIILLGPEHTYWLALIATMSGYLLYFWNRNLASVEQQSDSLRRRVYELEQTEEHLLRDQNSVQVVSRMTERQRIAEMLHDNLGHDLSAAHLAVKATGTLLEGKRYDAALRSQEKALQRLGNAIAELRSTVRRIEPEQENDLDRITRLVNSFSYPMEFSVEGNFSRVPAAVGQLLFVSMQEALTNIIKHAKPSLISVRLKITQAIVRAVIENDGIEEHAPPPTGSGLRYMRKRIEAVHGSLSIRRENVFSLIMIIPLGE